MQSHKQAVHGDDVFECPQTGCQFSSSRKASLTRHLKGFHGTAGSFACDHPGCTFRSTWRENIAKHKRHQHSDEKPFPCNYTGCSFRTKTNSHLTSHKNAVHLKVRDKRCHVCEKEFQTKSYLKAHMTTHEGDGHEMEKCEDRSVNLRRKSSCKTGPAAGKWFPCDHQGCDYKCRRKCDLLPHRKHAHSAERPFSCSHSGCTYRSKTKSNLMVLQKQVHQKIGGKCCHVGDMRLFSKRSIRTNMKSQKLSEEESQTFSG